MKGKLIYLFLLSLAMPGNAQIDDAKLTLQKAEMKADIAALRRAKDDCCNCPGNILKDGGFEKLTTNPNSTDISSASGPWSIDQRTPQWSAGEALCNAGFISMWGNQAPHESVKQTGVQFQPGKKYRGRFAARFYTAQPNPNSTHVQLQISINGAAVFTSTPITGKDWACYPIPEFTAPANTESAIVTLRPTNQHSKDDGALVSWIQLSSICIEEACNCDALPKELVITGPADFCKPKDCREPVVFTAPKLDAKCYKYIWEVSPKTKFEGANTDRIIIPCQQLKGGSYTVGLTVTCGDKSVTAKHRLTVCEKPSPAFTMTANGNTLQLTAAPGPDHYWFLVEDTNSDCVLSGTETATAAAPNPANTASFNTLAPGKQYIVYHFANAMCGERTPCWSLQTSCFKFTLPQQRGTPGTPPPAPVITKVSESVVAEARHWPVPPRYHFPLKPGEPMEADSKPARK